MKRYGVSHKAIIKFLLDGRARSRAEVEAEVISAFVRLEWPRPSHRQWKSGTTKSLKWLVAHGWLHTRYEGKGQEIFVIDKTKRKHYIKAMAAIEAQKAQGLADSRGVRRGPKREEPGQVIRVLGGREIKGSWIRRGPKSSQRKQSADIKSDRKK